MKTKIMDFGHGTTYDDANNKCSGWKQVELNDLGKEQAIRFGETNKDMKFDVIFTSDLVRSIDSSNLAFPNFDKIIDSRLRECNYGDYDGKDKSLVVYEEHINKSFPNGELLKDVEKRVREFLDEGRLEYPGKTIAIVGHRAPQLVLDVITKNISWE